VALVMKFQFDTVLPLAGQIDARKQVDILHGIALLQEFTHRLTFKLKIDHYTIHERYSTCALTCGQRISDAVCNFEGWALTSVTF